MHALPQRPRDLPSTGRDLRTTALYREIAAFYAAIHAPGSGCATDASDLAPSADGRCASYTGTRFDSLDAAPHTVVDTIDVDDGSLLRTPACKPGSRLPRWSPVATGEGATLAVVHDRDAGCEIVLHRGDTTSAIPVHARYVESLAWSPDGRRLLLGTAGFGADLAGCQGGATTRRAPDALPQWLPSTDTGDAEHLWREAYVVDVATCALRRIGPARLNVWECCWLGNERIAAVVSDSHSEGTWYSARLVEIDLDARIRELHRPVDQLGVPRANRSGRSLAFIEAVCSDRMIVAGTLCVCDPVTLRTRELDTHGVDVTHLEWRDDRRLVYCGLRGLETVIAEVDVESGVASTLYASRARTGAGWYPTVAPLPGDRVLMVGEAWGVPPEIACIEHGRYRVVRSLASAAASAPQFVTASTEPFTWTARDGLEIQGVLVKPANPGPWPLVVDIHGGPVWACRDRWQGRLRGAKVLADRGIASLYPNPRGSAGRGREFARLVRGDMGGEDTHDFLAGVDAAVARGIADPKRLGVTGISYGGYMSAWLVTQDPRFAAAAPISPVTNWFSQHRTSQIPQFDSLFLDGRPSASDGLFHARSPVMRADRVRTPVLTLAGALDQNTPPTQALEWHRSLLEHGAQSVLAIYPNAGHGIRSFPDVIDATTRYVDWFLSHFGNAR